jgi:hypothetical protein
VHIICFTVIFCCFEVDVCEIIHKGFGNGFELIVELSLKPTYYNISTIIEIVLSLRIGTVQNPPV